MDTERTSLLREETADDTDANLEGNDDDGIHISIESLGENYHRTT